MPGLVPGIHVLGSITQERKTWMAGSSPVSIRIVSSAFCGRYQASVGLYHSLRECQLPPSPPPTVTASAFAQPQIRQPSGEPVRQSLIEQAAGIDLRHHHLLLAERKVHADPVGEPQMRIGQRPQLVLVMFQRLVIGSFPDLDREQIVRNLALVHHDVGIDRFSEVIVGRDDRAMRQPQRTLAEPVEIAIDLPARKLLFAMHRQPVRQRPLTEVLVEQEGFARIKFLQGRDDLVQFGLHLASDPTRAEARAYNCTSISRGPGSAMASASALTRSSTLATARPGTPMPLASATKSMVGRSILSMSSARCPGSPAPTPSNSPRRIW